MPCVFLRSTVPGLLLQPCQFQEGLHLRPDGEGLNSEFFPEKLPRPSLCARPSSVVELGSSVTLQCRAGFQNATFVLGKSHDPGFKQERSSADTEAEFPLASLQPEDAGGYFCAYKTAATHQWSEQSQHLQLVVTGERVLGPGWGRRTPGAKNDLVGSWGGGS